MLNQYLKNPRNTGMIIASSSALAKAMTNNIQGFDTVLEIGAGSGAITKEIVKKVSSRNLKIYEHSSVLCKKLRKTVLQKIPDVLREGAAQNYKDEIVKEKNSIIISSLPFKSLPSDVSKQLVNLLCEFVSNEGCVLRQYSYMVPLVSKPPFEVSSEFEWKKIKTIYANVPPAQIWELRKK